MATGDDLDVALDAARAAGEVLLAHYGSSSGLREKTSRHDLVTDADLDADARVRSVLASSFPDDAIVTEERGGEPPAAGRTWFVDPLDGTTNFVHGFPHWCVSIALRLGERQKGGEQVVGGREAARSSGRRLWRWRRRHWGRRSWE